MTIPLSVLDLSPISEGQSSSDALRTTVELARHADELGYTRFWLAEHHNLASVASSAPEIVIGQVANATRRIRVGSGGVMLPNHAPLKVVETFRVLEAFYPERIDLGIGRAPGTDPLTAMALRRTREAFSADHFPHQLTELIGYSTGEFPAGHPYQNIIATPNDVPLPPVWLLGSTNGYSSQTAGALGFGFAFAYHINPSVSEAIASIQNYKEHFELSAQFPQPHAILALSVICAETDEEAEYQALPLKLSMLQLMRGRPAPLVSPEAAKAYPFTALELAQVEATHARHLIGSPQTVKGRIEELVQQTGADEVMVMTHLYGKAERFRSYTLLAEAFGLTATAPALT